MAETAHTTAEVQHGGGHSGVFPPFDSTTFASQILWLAITFGLFYVLMAKVVLPRIGGILEVRHDRIAGDLEEANRLKAESEAAGAAYEKALAEARRNAQGIAAETRAKLAAEVDAKRHAAEAGLSGKITEAEARIAEIKTKALGEVDGIAVDTTEALIAALIGEQVGRDDAVAAVAAVTGK
ncbi:F0F1 ATP synthase subunit B [Siculibacillus lacustris]|uniref:ATP synthase subunit b n=2 Tax=Siculibacillus lacustris TaxID=1549641 RepID=A0A4Q9VCR3_9HYPH|nr:F0F1 ATP synthase subunit B [Siculibacillus lacustris]